MKFVLEVIAFNVESCIIAERCGADRIELCDNPGEGGTTPSAGMIRLARENTSLLLYPIIRPRGGDFLYSEEEFQIMMEDVAYCRGIGCDGVVIGLLQSNGKVDTERTKQLVECAQPMGVTFHRAFDRVSDPFEALEEIIQCGCERILTSGLKPTVKEGLDTLKSLVRAAGNRIIIMPGSGLRAANIEEIARETGAIEFHSSARKEKASAMHYKNADMREDLNHVILDRLEVQNMRSILDKIQHI